MKVLDVDSAHGELEGAEKEMSKRTRAAEENKLKAIPIPRLRFIIVGSEVP